MNPRGTEREAGDAWKRMVLSAGPLPAWLAPGAPQLDVVLSTRARVLRNLLGHRFPHAAGREELVAISARFASAAPGAGLDLYRHLADADRDYLVGVRLASPEFAWNEPGRAILLDRGLALAGMVNEEDHLRLQSLAAGWAPVVARERLDAALASLGERLEWAWSPRFGYLSASPFNCGEGLRQSAMLHLIGLAHSRKLGAVLRALAARGLVARGLFGESSRAVGAFVQVSAAHGSLPDFVGACEYLLSEERSARATAAAQLAGGLDKALHFAQRSRTLTLAEALRVLAWVRWGSTEGRTPTALREVDHLLASIDLQAGSYADAGSRRAHLLRTRLGL